MSNACGCGWLCGCVNRFMCARRLCARIMRALGARESANRIYTQSKTPKIRYPQSDVNTDFSFFVRSAWRFAIALVAREAEEAGGRGGYNVVRIEPNKTQYIEYYLRVMRFFLSLSLSPSRVPLYTPHMHRIKFISRDDCGLCWMYCTE